MTNKFKYITDDISNFVQIEESKLQKSLGDYFGVYYYKQILNQVHKYMQENDYLMPPYEKALNIFETYEKLALNQLNFYECFYIVSMLLPNLNHMYKQSQTGNISINYYIDNFISNEINLINQIKKRE